MEAVLYEQRGDIDITGIELEKKFINTYVSKSIIRLKTMENEDKMYIDISSLGRRNKELIIY